MKRLITLAVLLCGIAIPSARAVSLPTLPFLGPLRVDVVNQQVIASNNIAMTNDIAGNKKLLASLKKALKTIEKTKTNYAAGAKSLGVLAKTLNRTSISNVFIGDFEGTVEDYIAALIGEENSLSNRLASAYPSKAHTSALTTLGLLDDALNGAAGSSDIIAAAKFLSTAAKNFAKAAKLTDKAEDAPAPASGLTATITGALHSSFNDFNTTITLSGSDIGINSSTKPSTSGSDNIIMDLLNVVDGTQTVDVRGAYSQVRPGGRSFGGNAIVNGTATITYNSATKVIFGTFSFVGDEGGASTATVTVSGSFSGTAL